VTYPERLHLPVDEVRVWWAHARPRSAELLAMLDPIEATRHAALRRSADRDRFASAHLLTRVVLAGYLATSPDEVAIRAVCKVCGAEGHGKPELWDPELPFRFSQAYAGARVGVAVARVPVGLDVAVLDVERSLEDTLTAVRDEALLKATGDGHAVPAPEVIRPDPEDVQLADLAPGAGHVAALALLTAEAPGPQPTPPYTITEGDGEPLIAAADPPSVA
jgi:4'-phosphopantetheinyl transferase